jgi:hypothetical protein
MPAAITGRLNSLAHYPWFGRFDSTDTLNARQPVVGQFEILPS